MIAVTRKSHCSQNDCLISPFQCRVYQLVAQIPRGRVMTYRGIASAIRCASCQAVGQALRKNPFAPHVPCHRVIKSDLTSGGFLGKRESAAIQRKLELLEAEGVDFKDGVLSNPDWVVTLG